MKLNGMTVMAGLNRLSQKPEGLSVKDALKQLDVDVSELEVVEGSAVLKIGEALLKANQGVLDRLNGLCSALPDSDLDIDLFLAQQLNVHVVEPEAVQVEAEKCKELRRAVNHGKSDCKALLDEFADIRIVLESVSMSTQQTPLMIVLSNLDKYNRGVAPASKQTGSVVNNWKTIALDLISRGSDLLRMRDKTGLSAEDYARKIRHHQPEIYDAVIAKKIPEGKYGDLFIALTSLRSQGYDKRSLSQLPEFAMDPNGTFTEALSSGALHIDTITTFYEKDDKLGSTSFPNIHNAVVTSGIDRGFNCYPAALFGHSKGPRSLTSKKAQKILDKASSGDNPKLRRIDNPNAIEHAGKKVLAVFYGTGLNIPEDEIAHMSVSIEEGFLHQHKMCHDGPRMLAEPEDLAGGDWKPPIYYVMDGELE